MRRIANPARKICQVVSGNALVQHQQSSQKPDFPMNCPFTSPPWSIELAPGWNAEHRSEFRDGHRDEYVAVVPPTGDALLRFSSQEFPAGGVDDAETWVEHIALINRARGRPVSSVDCGDFTGYLTSFFAGTDLLRGWVLRRHAFPLDACYRCDAKHEGRDDLAVDAMLNTLRYQGPAVSP
jgi:hypothetical protein